MQKFFLLLLAIGGVAACKEDQPAPSLGQQFALPLSQTTTLATSGSPLSITLTEVRDSRCPINAYCIVAGYAAVTLALKDESAAIQTVRISLRTKDIPQYSVDSVAITLNQQPYWLRLLDVTPYPATTGGTSQAATAILRLRPR